MNVVVPFPLKLGSLDRLQRGCSRCFIRLHLGSTLLNLFCCCRGCPCTSLLLLGNCDIEFWGFQTWKTKIKKFQLELERNETKNVGGWELTLLSSMNIREHPSRLTPLVHAYMHCHAISLSLSLSVSLHWGALYIYIHFFMQFMHALRALAWRMLTKKNWKIVRSISTQPKKVHQNGWNQMKISL
jgi:hypothetical protein